MANPKQLRRTMNQLTRHTSKNIGTIHNDYPNTPEAMQQNAENIPDNAKNDSNTADITSPHCKQRQINKSTMAISNQTTNNMKGAEASTITAEMTNTSSKR